MTKSDTPKVHTPHDALFKWAHKHPRHAVGPLRASLGLQLAAAIDWRTLKREPGSYVSESLRDLRTDLLFSARLRQGVRGQGGGGRRVFMYLLLEHQSSCNRLMAARLFVYVARILEAWLVDNPDATQVPAIMPMVSYHGDGVWSAPRRLTELIDLPLELLNECRQDLPELRYLLDDLVKLTDEQILARQSTAFVRLVELVLKHGRTDNALHLRLQPWGPLLRAVFRMEDGTVLLRVIFRYIQVVNNQVTEEQLMSHLKPVFDDDASAVDAFLFSDELLIERAHEKGLSKGKRAVLERQLCIKFGVLPAAIVQQLKTAGAEQLDCWVDRVLTATTLDEVFAGTP